MIEKVNSVFEIEALKQEFDFFVKGMEKAQTNVVDLYKTIEQYKGTGIKTLAKDQQAAVDASNKAQVAADKLAEAQRRAEEAMKRSTMASVQARQNNVDLGKTYQDMSGSIEQNIRLQLRYKKELEDLKAQQKELSRAFGGTKESAASLQAKQIEVAQSMEEIKQASAELGRTIRLQVKEQNAAGGSLDEMKAKYDRLFQVLRGLSDSDRDSEIGKQLKKDLEDLSNQINEIQKSAGNFSGNVGRYMGSLAPAFSALGDELTRIRAELATMDKGSAGFDDLVKQEQLLTRLTETLGQDFKNAGQEISALQDAAKQLAGMWGVNSNELKSLNERIAELGKVEDKFNIGAKFDDVYETVQPLTSRLGELEDRLYELALAGKKNTEEFKTLEAEAIKYRKTIIEVDDVVDRAASRTAGFDRWIAAAQGVAGAFSVAEGAAALFGNENEELQRTFVKLQALMTIMTGLQEVSNFLKTKDTIITRTQVAIQTLYARAVSLSTAAMGKFGKALLLTGLFTLVPLLAAAAKALYDMKKAGEEAAKSQARLDEVGKKAADSYMEQKVKLTQLTTAVKSGKLSVKEKERVVKEYNKTFGDSIGKAKDFTDAENKIINIGPKYIEMIMLQAKAQAAFGLAVEASKEALVFESQGAEESIGFARASFIKLSRLFTGDADKQIRETASRLKNTKEDEASEYLKLQEQFLQGAQKIADENGFKTEDMKQAGKDMSNIRKELSDREAKAFFELQQARLKAQADAAKRILDNEETMYAGKLIALTEFMQKESEMANREKDFLLNNDKLTKSEREKIEFESQLRIAEINREGFNVLNALRKTQMEKEKADMEAFAKEMAELPEKIRGQVTESATQRSLIDLFTPNDQELTERLNALTDKLKTRQITYEQYQQQLEEINVEFARRELSRQESLQQQIISTLKAQGVDVSQELIRLNEIKRQLYDADAKAFEDGEKKKADAAKETLDKIAAVMQVLSEITSNLINSGIEIATINIDRQRVAIEELDATQQSAYEKEVARIAASTLSEQEKADKLKIIEAERMAQKENNERKQRRLDIERARYQKVADVANIISGTAMAVVRALATQPTPLGIALAATVGALGAAQLARAVATPLPKFEKGTASAPGGFAITDEKGAEMYIEPGGKTYMGSDRGPVMRYLKPGTKVIPADEVNQMLYKSMLADTAQRLGMLAGHRDESKTDKALHEIREAIFMQTEATIREMKKQKRATKINNVIDLGYMQYIQQKTFN